LQANPHAKRVCFRKCTPKYRSDLDELFHDVQNVGKRWLGSQRLQSAPFPSFETSQREFEWGEGLANINPLLHGLGASGFHFEMGETSTGATASSATGRGSGGLFLPDIEYSLRPTKDGVALATHGLGAKTEKFGASRSEQAVRILQDCYSIVLMDEDLLKAMEVFERIQMSEIFVAINPGLLRDKWLHKQIALAGGDVRMGGQTE
jgi:hypothetical protein